MASALKEKHFRYAGCRAVNDRVVATGQRLSKNKKEEIYDK
jgi:hypothetical protein